MRKRLVLPLLLAIGLLTVPAVSQAYLTGVADENSKMFSSPFYTQLIAPQSSSHRISRYIAPYDVANGNKRNSFFLDQFIVWYRAAQAQHVQILVAFYHSELSPNSNPSTKTYQTDVGKFMKMFPAVSAWQPWNETNRGTVRGKGGFHSPSAVQSAQYYKAMRSECPKVTRHCTILGLDVLDQNNVRPTLTYISQFRSELRHLHVPTPKLWGLHNYSDTNRFSSTRTKDVLRAVPGQVWLTETGGLVSFGGAFTNHNGSGDKRAARALTYMFNLAASNSRITRLYIYTFFGGQSSSGFDAGLVDTKGTPRPGYVVVCKKLHAKRCSGFKLDTKH